MNTPERWTDEQLETYTRIFRFMLVSPRCFQHPEATPVPAEHWHTTAHNAAWYAAEALEAEEFIIRDSETDAFYASDVICKGRLQ